MADIGLRTNQRSFLEQRILNNYPERYRARREMFSAIGQMVHPFGGRIEELGVDVQRSIYNYFAQTFEPTEMDNVYEIPKVLDAVSVIAYLDATSTVRVTKVSPSLEDLWYLLPPTRLEVVDTQIKTIYPSRQCNSVREDKSGSPYFISDHLSSSVITRTGSSHWNASEIDLSWTAGGWGSGESLYLLYTSTSSPGYIQATSNSTSTGEGLGLWSFIQGNCTAIKAEVGYLGVGSSVQTFTSLTDHNSIFLSYLPNATQTGIPYAKFELLRTSTSSCHAWVSDFAVVSYKDLYSVSTNPKIMHGFNDCDANWAYISFQGASNFINASTTPGINPTTVHITGIGMNNYVQEERVMIPFEGVHKSFKLFKDISSIVVENAMPWTSTVSCQLQNYSSTSHVQDFLSPYADRYHENILFYSVNSSGGTSMLQYDSFLNDDVGILLTDYSALVTKMKLELLTTSTASFACSDIKLDQFNRHIYALDQTNDQVHIYDCNFPWPNKEYLAWAATRVIDPFMKIMEVDEHERFLQRNESLSLEANWTDRSTLMTRYRWKLVKPDLSIVGINSAGAEVGVNTNYWIDSDAYKDPATEEYLTGQHRLTYQPTDLGWYVMILESEFRDEVDGSAGLQTDTLVFGCISKLPRASFTLNSTTSPLGIDLDYFGNLRVAYSYDNSIYRIQEKVFKRRYDYYIEDVDNNKYYFRELYNMIKLRSWDEVAGCYRTVTIVNSDTAIAVSDMECGVIVINTTSGPVNVNLPALSSSEDGLETKFVRYGGNTATITPDGSNTIDGAVDKDLLSDRDSITTVYISDLTDLMLWG